MKRPAYLRIIPVLAALIISLPNLEGATARSEPMLLDDVCDENCGINLDTAPCLAREQICRTKLNLYNTYMGQLGLGVALHRLPQLYIDLLQPHYQGANLGNWRFGFSDRQPPNNATTDCSVTYFNDSAFVDRLENGELETTGNFGWLLHELQHFVQCSQGGGRDKYARRWFRELELNFLQNNNLRTLHDRMPMEGDAASVANLNLGRIAQIRDVSGRLVRPFSIRVLHNSSPVTSTLAFTHNAEARFIADSSGGSNPLEIEWRVRAPGSTTFQRRTGSGSNGTRIDLTLDQVGFYDLRAKVFQPNSDLIAAEKNVRLNVTQPPPAAPTSPQAIGISPTSIRVSWQDASNNENSFRIERLPQQGVTRVYPAAANATSVDDSGLLPGSEHRYKVCAENSGGTTCSSIFSGSTLPPTELAAPVNVVVTGKTEHNITLSWQDISLETGFRIEREIDGAFRVVSTAPANATSGTVKLLQPNTLYRFRVCASDGARSICGGVIEVRTPPVS